ncbi:MAG: CBS domain-containing protein [Candidatus Thermoplasmatota archaeon]
MDYIPVREVMSKEPVTASPKMNLAHAADLMREEDVGSLIVVRKNVPIGVVTESDFLRKAVAKNLKPSQATLKDIMSTPIITIGPEEDIIDAAKKMADLKIRRLAVIDDGKLIGIITESDILRISPTLIEITREYAKINSYENVPVENLTSGICECCNAYSDSLIEKDGMLICDICEKEERF